MGSYDGELCWGVMISQYPSIINNQQSAINNQQSTISNQQSVIKYPFRGETFGSF